MIRKQGEISKIWQELCGQQSGICSDDRGSTWSLGSIVEESLQICDQSGGILCAGKLGSGGKPSTPELERGLATPKRFNYSETPPTTRLGLAHP